MEYNVLQVSLFDHWGGALDILSKAIASQFYMLSIAFRFPVSYPVLVWCWKIIATSTSE